METDIIVAVIGAGGNVVSAILAGGIAALIGTRFLSQQVLRQQLKEARSDIAFLLTMEYRHCMKHKENSNKSYFRTIRAEVYEAGAYWSGKHTPDRVK